MQIQFNHFSRILTIIGLFASSLSFGQLQKAPGSKKARYHVKADRFVFAGDEVFYINRDTVLFFSDTIEVAVRKHSIVKSDHFYDNVKTKMSKTKVSKMFYELLFKQPDGHKSHSESESQFRFMPYQNDRVELMSYKNLKPFGSKMSDTSYLKVDKYADILNKTHLHTQRWIVRKNLLFRQGDRIDPNQMVESERLLRRQRYIKDAKIMVDESSGSEHARVVVVTKDVFPYNLTINPNNANNALFGVSNINIGGIGHELEYNYVEVGKYEFFYRIRNAFGTFTDIELNHANHFRKTGNGIRATRDFVTPETKYAGGFEYSDYEFGEFDYQPITDVTTEFYYKRNRQDLWLGRAFKSTFQSGFLGFDDETYVVASARVDYQNFYDRPPVTETLNYRYHDRRNILFSLGFSTREYYKDKFISNYGRTEDIPVGTVWSGVVGQQRREFKDRVYIGGRYARGGYLKGIGYLNNAFSLGGFVESGGIKDGVFRGDMNYFSPLFTFVRFRFRQFVNFSFAQTINPTEDLFLRTQNDLGIRGVTSYFLRSTQRANLKMESLLFTPAKFIGFKLAVFGFFDYTATGNSRDSFFQSEKFWGAGGGIRLRNDNLAFSTIQLRYGYYPDLPINADPNIINITTSTGVVIRDFNMGAPEIVPFR